MTPAVSNSPAPLPRTARGELLGAENPAALIRSDLLLALLAHRPTDAEG